MRIVKPVPCWNAEATGKLWKKNALACQMASLGSEHPSTLHRDDSHNNIRVAASSLLFNIATTVSRERRASSSSTILPDSDQVELAASVLEAITQETSSSEALHGMLLALGNLVYCAPLDGELVDLLRTMDAKDTILAKAKEFPKEDLVKEVGEELLGRGLKQP